MLNINSLRTRFNTSGAEALFQVHIPSPPPAMLLFPEKLSAQLQNNDSKGGQNRAPRLFLSPEMPVRVLSGWSQSRTFTPGQRVVPVSVGAVLTGQDWVADQLVARQTLKRDGLADVVTGSSYNAISKRFRVRAFLQLVGWNKKKNPKIRRNISYFVFSHKRRNSTLSVLLGYFLLRQWLHWRR